MIKYALFPIRPYRVVTASEMLVTTRFYIATLTTFERVTFTPDRGNANIVEK